MKNIDIFDKYDISIIKELISKIPEEDWVRNTSRQNTFEVHKNTKTIFNTDFPNSWDGVGYPIVKYELPAALQQQVDHYIKILEDKYNGKVGKSMFSMLNPESFIAPHVDGGLYLTKCKRCHIVIKTNDFVHFFAGNEWTIFEEGDCFELNNQVMHSVINYSKEPRIHLMIDIILNEVFQ